MNFINKYENEYLLESSGGGIINKIIEFIKKIFRGIANFFKNIINSLTGRSKKIQEVSNLMENDIVRLEDRITTLDIGIEKVKRTIEKEDRFLKDVEVTGGKTEAELKLEFDETSSKYKRLSKELKDIQNNNFSTASLPNDTVLKLIDSIESRKIEIARIKTTNNSLVEKINSTINTLNTTSNVASDFINKRDALKSSNLYRDIIRIVDSNPNSIDSSLIFHKFLNGIMTDFEIRFTLVIGTEGTENYIEKAPNSANGFTKELLKIIDAQIKMTPEGFYDYIKEESKVINSHSLKSLRSRLPSLYLNGIVLNSAVKIKDIERAIKLAPYIVSGYKNQISNLKQISSRVGKSLEEAASNVEDPEFVREFSSVISKTTSEIIKEFMGSVDLLTRYTITMAEKLKIIRKEIGGI